MDNHRPKCVSLSTSHSGHKPLENWSQNLDTHLWGHWAEVGSLTRGPEMKGWQASPCDRWHACTLPLPLLLQQVGEVVALVHVVSVLVLLAL